MKYRYPRVFRTILLLALTLLVYATAEAKQPDRTAGTYIPVLKNAHVDDLTASRWVESKAGSYLEVMSSAGETWDVLDQALTNLDIKPVTKDAASRQWLTDWVVWKYNKRKGTGRSKPAFSFGDSSLERHQFLITVKPGNNREHAVIVIMDHKREREEDLTPDSMASWLEWKPNYLQQGAADTFLKRLQLPIESALVTEFVAAEEISRTTTGELVVTEATTNTSADVVVITIPRTETAPLQLQTPELAPPASNKAVEEPYRENVIQQPVKTAQEPVDAEIPAKRAMLEQPPAPEPAPAAEVVQIQQPEEASVAYTVHRPQETAPEPTPSMPVEETVIPVSPVRSEVKEQSAPAIAHVDPIVAPVRTKNPVLPVTTATNGLLVRASPEVAWPALLQALRDLDVTIEQEGRGRRQLTTGWVDASYDKKNQQLMLESKEGTKWAFDMFGKGVERQQYKVVMVAANKGERSIIYAYNTGYQQQVDQTPDSSQTMLAWEDQDTSPDVALAFLRKLRIIIPH